MEKNKENREKLKLSQNQISTKVHLPIVTDMQDIIKLILRYLGIVLIITHLIAFAAGMALFNQIDPGGAAPSCVQDLERVALENSEYRIENLELKDRFDNLNRDHSTLLVNYNQLTVQHEGVVAENSSLRAKILKLESDYSNCRMELDFCKIARDS